MTQISTIHGISSDEWPDRSTNVVAKEYFPYLSMTKGELELALLRQRALTYRQFAPEMGIYSRAVSMLDRALNDGVNGAKFIGAVPDQLQPLARIISKAVTDTQPASRAGFFGRNTSAKVGEILPATERRARCIEERLAKYGIAKNRMTRPTTPGAEQTVWDVQVKPALDSVTAACNKQFEIERILNAGIEKSGHHMLYKSVPREYDVPGDVRTKRILHGTGIEGMALVGEIDKSLMYLWVENGIVLKNTEQKIGPLSSVTSSLYLAPDPQQALAKFKTWGQQQSAEKWQKITTGAAINAKISIDPITAGVLVAIAGALVEAFGFLKSLRSQKDYAMVQAQGFGTEAYSANNGDWLGGQTEGGGMSTSTLLMLGGAALVLSQK
jgi:hypothetical protein